MSSPHSPSIHLPNTTDENPTLLTIRSSSTSLFGANASKYGFESCQRGLSTSVSANTGENSESGVHSERSRSLEAAGVQRAGDIEINTHVEKVGSGFGIRSFEAGGRAGGKFRTSHQVNKRTPYERPLTGRHATACGSSHMASSPLPKKLTIASRLRNTATWLIHSSASYLFSAAFKRSPPRALQIDEEPQGFSIPMKQQASEEKPDVLAIQNASSVLANWVPALTDADLKSAEAETSVPDICKIEELLKQKTLSRDQVDRLTQILQKQMSENSKANNIIEPKNLQDELAVDTSPIQVARAYMGEQVTRPSGLAATVRTSAFAFSQSQSSPERTLVEERYASSPFSQDLGWSSASVQMPKRSLVMEDDTSLMGPVRRVRQKASLLTTASPGSYSRLMTGPSKPAERRISSPPSQSSQTAMKILETLEKLSPSPKGKLLGAMTEKSLNGPRVLEKFSPSGHGKVTDDLVIVSVTGVGKHTPQTSRARNRNPAKYLSSIALPKLAEAKAIGKPIFGPTFGDVNFMGTEFKSPSSMPQKSYNISMPSEGFRMNAACEETLSEEEEVKLQAKPHVSNLAEVQLVSSKEEAILTEVSSVAPFIKADILAPSAIMLLEPVPSSVSRAAFFTNNYNTPPHIAAVPYETAKNLLSSPSFSFPAAATDQKTASTAAPITLSDKKEHIVFNTSAVTSASASKSTLLSYSRSIEAPESLRMFSSAVTSASASKSTLLALPVSLAIETGSSGNARTDVSGVSSALLPTSNTIVDLFESKNLAIMATDSCVSAGQGEGNIVHKKAATSGGDSPVYYAPNALFNANLQPSVSSSFLFAAGTSGSSLFTSAGSGTVSTGALVSSLASPFSFSAQSSTTSVPNPFNGLSAPLSSAPAFAFGCGQSGASLTGEKCILATGASGSLLSVSPFAFAGQSATVPTGQGPNLTTKPIFSQSCAIATAQTPCFSSLPNNPFQSTAGSPSLSSFGSSNAAVFGSTTASSLVSTFTFSSPLIPSFGGASTVQSGAHSMSSSLITGPGAAASDLLSIPLVSTSPAPTTTRTADSSFGANVASTPSSASSTKQTLAFTGPQLNFCSANLSSSGTESMSFNSGGAACFTTVSCSTMFMSGSNVPNVFSFGSASTSNHSPFAFSSGQISMVKAPPFMYGNQPPAAPAAFNGGQSSAPVSASNPFSAAGAMQPGFGFALGASGGDKSGRKFIKAKRIRGAKKENKLSSNGLE